MRKEKMIEVLEKIERDTKDDARAFEGKPFSGRTVAEYFGNQGAAIIALSLIVKEMIIESIVKEKA